VYAAPASEKQYTAADGELQVAYLGVVSTSDGGRNKEIDKQIGKAKAVLRELYCSVLYCCYGARDRKVIESNP